MVTVSQFAGDTDSHLVAHGEASQAATCAQDDTGRAGTRISDSAARLGLRADLRDRDGLDSMADAVDVQPDLVARRDVGDRRHLDVGCAGRCVHAQVGLRARLANLCDRDDLVPLHAPCDIRVGGAIAEGASSRQP